MPPSPQVPLSARVMLAHAAVQALAEDCGADLLFVKGPTTDPDLRAFHTGGSDVDALVRPAHADRLVGALHEHGWRLVTDFRSGSAFDHAANFFHDQWGMVDVHRTFPGIDRDPEATFERLWSQRRTRLLAHYPCPVPSRTAQALVVLLHAARTPVNGGGLHPDVTTAWHDQDADHRKAVTALAQALGARTPLLVALGQADAVRGEPDAPLRVWFSDRGSRLQQWRARMAVAPTWRAKAAIARRALGVNTYYLQQRLGHPPSRAEVAREFVRRVGAAAQQGATAARAAARTDTRRRRGRHLGRQATTTQATRQERQP